ncbi:hypothetical protein BBAD15_g12472 [Beauveria bassiana D1-5]|uniref:Uncharacterized protein n=1 Tax=Beauveria bassiana D1-5 TaxID=1245745 RepID=A0A0A2VNA0_BEABA|nr:hypothetical protein BBAD15_g12472 [Beauveria bassiana D1-5]
MVMAHDLFDGVSNVVEWFAGLRDEEPEASRVNVTRDWVLANASLVQEVVQSDATDVALCGATGALLRKFERDTDGRGACLQWFDRVEMSKHVLGFARACRPLFGRRDHWRLWQPRMMSSLETHGRWRLHGRLMLVANLETLIRLCLVAATREESTSEMDALCGVIWDKLGSMAWPGAAGYGGRSDLSDFAE